MADQLALNLAVLKVALLAAVKVVQLVHQKAGKLENLLVQLMVEHLVDR